MWGKRWFYKKVFYTQKVNVCCWYQVIDKSEHEFVIGERWVVVLNIIEKGNLQT